MKTDHRTIALQLLFTLLSLGIVVIETKGDDDFFKKPSARVDNFFNDASTQTDPVLITSPDEFDTSQLLSRKEEFRCAKRSLLLYKLVLNSVSRQFQILDDSPLYGHRDLDLTIRIYSYELDELQKYLDYLSRMLTFELEHLDGDLSVETKHFCLHMNQIEKKVVQLIHRLEPTSQNGTSFSLWPYFQRKFAWIRLDIEQGTKDKLQFYGFILFLEAIIVLSIYYYPFPPLSKLSLTIMNLIVLYTFLEHYHEQMLEFDAEQERQQMLQSFVSKEPGWLTKYLPWKSADALGMPRARQQFKPKMLDLFLSFFLHYQRIVWRSMTEFLNEFLDIFYKPQDMGTSAILYVIIKPFLVLILIATLLYFGLFQTFVLSFSNLTNWFGGGDAASAYSGGGGTSTTTTTNNSSVTNNTYFIMPGQTQQGISKLANQMPRISNLRNRKIIRKRLAEGAVDQSKVSTSLVPTKVKPKEDAEESGVVEATSNTVVDNDFGDRIAKDVISRINSAMPVKCKDDVKNATDDEDKENNDNEDKQAKPEMNNIVLQYNLLDDQQKLNFIANVMCNLSGGAKQSKIFQNLVNMANPNEDSAEFVKDNQNI